MEDIDKKIKKRFDKMNEDIVEIIKEEKEKNRISLRKKKIQNLIMTKRYYESFSNIDYNINHKNNNSNSKNNAENEYMFDISSLLIKEELKKKDTIEGIILEKHFYTIFGYIKEIYKKNNFQIDILKYGLFLLNEKLLRYNKNEDNINNKEENNLIIDILIKLNLEDILTKLLIFSKNEIKKDDKDHLILNLAYQILVNYSYLANESQLSFLISDEFIQFHLFFLDNFSEDQIFINILRMLYNIFLYNELFINKFFNYNNYKLINILNDYLSSAIKARKNIIVNKILDIYFCYIEIIDENIKENSKYINQIILNEIYLATLQAIFVNNKDIFSNGIYIIGTMYKILFKINNIIFLSELILGNNDTKSMMSYILDYDYSTSAENIIDFCNIFCYLIKCESYSNNLEIKKQLKKFIIEINNSHNLKGDEIIIITVALIQRNYTKKIFSKLINVLIAFCDSETFYINLFESLSNPVLLLINNIDCRIYKIKKKVLIALEKLTEKHELKLSNELVRNHIFNKIKYAIDPYDSYCRDEDIITICLNIIKNLLEVGDIIKSLGGKNNTLEAFENYGGKEMIEKFLDNKNKTIYEKALEIYNAYFNVKDD